MKYFKETDLWGDFKKINPKLVVTLEAYREYVNTPIIISRGTQGNISDGSQHGFGNAVDIVFPQKSVGDLLELAVAAMRFSAFRGIGIYPDWKLSGVIRGGLHLDVRTTELKAVWLGRREPSGENQYYGFSVANLRLLGLI